MSAQKFYEQMRKAGLTEDITSNESPDYNLSFYQSIFRLMEDFAKKELEEKLRWIPIEEKLPAIRQQILLKINDDSECICFGFMRKEYQFIQDVEFTNKDIVTHWRYFL